MMEEHFRSDEEKQGSPSEVEEIRRRLHKAVTSYRETKQIHDTLFEGGQITEEQINAVEAENKIFTNTLKKLQQQMETKRKIWKLLAQRETLMRIMEENQLLKDKHEHLTAELFCFREKDQKIRSAVQKFQDKLEELQGVLHSIDEQIHKLSRTVIQKNKETEENLKTIEGLKKEQRELQRQLGARQEDEILAALQFQEESSTLTEPQNMIPQTGQNILSILDFVWAEKVQRPPHFQAKKMDEKDKKHQDQTEKTKRSWWCDCAKVLWKGVKLGSIILGLLFLAASVCSIPDPDCSPWSVGFDLLEPSTKLSCRVPSVY